MTPVRVYVTRAAELLYFALKLKVESEILDAGVEGGGGGVRCVGACVISYQR